MAVHGEFLPFPLSVLTAGMVQTTDVRLPMSAIPSGERPLLGESGHARPQARWTGV